MEACNFYLLKPICYGICQRCFPMNSANTAIFKKEWLEQAGRWMIERDETMRWLMSMKCWPPYSTLSGHLLHMEWIIALRTQRKLWSKDLTHIPLHHEHYPKVHLIYFIRLTTTKPIIWICWCKINSNNTLHHILWRIILKSITDGTFVGLWMWHWII